MEKRRGPRALTLTLPDTRQPFLVIDKKRYTLRNFSEDGIGVLLIPPLKHGLTKGRTMSGDVTIGNQIFPVKLEAIHVSEKLLGLKIIHKSPELTQIFKDLLHPATYAMTLKERPESGTPDPVLGYNRLWYSGKGGTELMVWYNESSAMILSLQLCWIGKWVFRRQFQPTETGNLSDNSPKASGSLRGDEVILHDTTVNRNTLQHAAVFLSACPPPLPGHLLWQFLETGEQVYIPRTFLSKTKVA